MISNVVFTPASDADVERGLLAFVRCRVGPFLLDGIALRRTLGGELTLSWPARRDRAGRDHPLVRPCSDVIRRQLEEEVFAALREQEGWR